MSQSTTASAFSARRSHRGTARQPLVTGPSNPRCLGRVQAEPGSPRSAVAGHAERDNLRAISCAFGIVTTRAESAIWPHGRPTQRHFL